MQKRNENRPGYKETKVGWIPDEWGCKSFKHFTYNSEYGLSISSEENGRIPILGMSSLQDGKIHLNSNTPRVNISKDEFERYRIRKGDILFNRTNSLDLVGKVSLSKEDLNYVFASYLVRFNLNENLLSEFVNYCFNYADFIKRLKRLATPGVSQYNINPETLKKHFYLPHPQKGEQKKIAQILSAWDKAIEQTRKLIDAKKELKKGLMQQLLTGRMRFPQFGKPTAKGEIPEGWREVKLGKCFRERNETNPDLHLLSITSAKGVILRDEVDRKDISNVDKSKYKVIKVGDIGYNTMRMWQGVSAVSKFEGIVSPAYTICTPINRNSPEYFGYLFKYLPMIHLFYRYSQGLVSDTWNLKYHHFSIIKTIIPDPEEQEKIASCLMKIDDEIAYLNEKMNVLIQQKKGMMQKLLTGEIRVNHLIKN